MRHLNVFRYLTSSTSRLGFYTKESKRLIPETPGCYAWLLPLWLYRDDLDGLVEIICAMLDYEQEPTKRADVRFTWHTVGLNVSRTAKHRARTTDTYSTWKELTENKKTRRALQQTLLEASLLMPPLYVGRTNNLKQRYLQHAEDRGGKQNDFHSRFTDHTARLGLKITVSDLLFFCIETPSELRRYFGKSDQSVSNVLIENLLMSFCRPPFSVR